MGLNRIEQKGIVRKGKDFLGGLGVENEVMVFGGKKWRG